MFDYFNFLSNKNNYDKCIIESLIDNFFIEISKDIISYMNIFHLSEIIINNLLRILLKINVISENIDYVYNYLEKKYKTEKKEIKENINLFEKNNRFLENKKFKLERLKKNIKKKMYLLSKKKSPYCEKTIHYYSYNKKEFLLNNKLNSIICIKPKYLKKTKFDINNSDNSNLKVINQKQNLIKYLTSYSKENSFVKKQKNHSKIISKSEMVNIKIESPFSSSKNSKNINNKSKEIKYILNNKNNKSSDNKKKEIEKSFFFYDNKKIF